MGEVVGWLLDRDDRARLLAAFPPRFPEAVAHHVTLASDPQRLMKLPTAGSADIVGEACDEAGVQALVVAIDGSTERPGGGRYHITWSLGPGRRAKESNDVIARLGWRPIAEHVQIKLNPARF